MWKCGLVIEKYWVAQSEHFRLTTTVALGMGIIDAKLLFCDGISEKIGTRNLLWDITMAGQCVTSSATPLNLIMISHI